MSDPEEVSVEEDLGGGDEGRRTSKKEKASSGLILRAEKKEKKERKEKKEKETRYAHLGDESSGEDDADGKSPAKTKRSKPFMFGSAKKDKEKKKEARDHSTDTSKEKKKDKKDKPKLKLIKGSSKHHSDPVQEKVEDCPIFGVPLELATERHKSHDGIALPVIVRQCIDHIEEHGLRQEGIYRSSGVKSKVTKLRNAFNSRPERNQMIDLNAYEPAVVASVFKQFLRELPNPVLTEGLTPKFEEVSANPAPQKRIEGMKDLLNQLPTCNRLLVQWTFTHMIHVVERERFNKMTLQNVSIVLSPTMRISHRVLNCFFENGHILFDGVVLKKYVPPITGESGTQGQSRLPDSPGDIEEEIKKQESLLTDLHRQISSGAASKNVEEQIWEQQRIVTQLKRKLRLAKNMPESGANSKPKYEPIEYDEVLNFSLQTPADVEKSPIEEVPKEEPSPVREEVESPENTEDTEHQVTVMVHQSAGEKSKQEETDGKEVKVEAKATTPTSPAKESVRKSSKEDLNSFPILPPPPQPTKIRAGHAHILRPTPASPNRQLSNPTAPPASLSIAKGQDVVGDIAKSRSLPRGLPSDARVFDGFAPSESREDVVHEAGDELGEEPRSLNPFPIEADTVKEREEEEIERKLDALELESLRCQFEYEELMALKSELERRKREERREMEELREELATMQTLYQYRTYSVDSSESSSDEAAEPKEGKDEELGELEKVLQDEIRKNGELESTRQSLCQKIQEERAACVNLRVQIRLEQERRKRKIGRPA